MMLIFKQWINNRNLLISLTISMFIHFFVLYNYFQVYVENKNEYKHIYVIKINKLPQVFNKKNIDEPLNLPEKNRIDSVINYERPFEKKNDNLEEKIIINNNENIYFERNQLTITPKLTNTIILDYPIDFFSKQNTYITKITVYINKNGIVDLVEFSDINFPDVLKNVVLTEFTNANFSAGEIDSTLVNSKIHIEVQFDK